MDAWAQGPQIVVQLWGWKTRKSAPPKLYPPWWIGWIWTEQLYESHSFHMVCKSRVITCFCSPKQRFHSLLDLFHDGFTSPRSIKQSYLRRQPNEAEPVNHVEGGRINVLLAELARRTWSFTLFFWRFRVHQEWVKVWTISGASDSHISESPQKPMRFQSAFPNWRCRLTSRFPPFNTQFDHSKSKERDWHWAWVPAPTVRHGTISVVLLTTPLLAPGILWKNSEYLNSIYYY